MITILTRITAMYGVSKVLITRYRDRELWDYFHRHCMLSKNLKNAALFRMRQNFTAHGKDNLTDNELEVLAEVENTIKRYHTGRPKSVISYGFMERLMRANSNPDFFAGLPMQSAQAVLSDVHESFIGWLKALKEYKATPEMFTGKPRMPKYSKKDEYKVTYTNQDAVIYHDDGNTWLKLPLTKHTVTLDAALKAVKLKEVQCIPYYGEYMLMLTYENDARTPVSDMPYIAAIDTGLDNTAAVVSNSGSAGRIYKGGAIKACNQWFNKKMAHLRSIRMAGHDPETYHPVPSKRMKQLSRYRDCFLNDFFHKICADIVKWLIKEQCGTLVVGVNKMQKQGAGMGKKNNQNFVQVPLYTFRSMLRYLCERNGIIYVEREESYTSKASLMDMDYIPTCGKDDDKASFSGKRISRGLYRAGNGTFINADINAAGNILRKAFPDAFKNTEDMSCFKNVDVIRFHDMYLKRNPAKRIGAV